MRGLMALGVAAITLASGIAAASPRADGSGSLAPTGTPTLAPAAVSAPNAYVVVDSVGFTPGEAKRAYLVTQHAIHNPTFAVLNSSNHEVMSSSSSVRRGRWSARYPDVYEFSFTSLNTPGTYTIHVSGSATATSESFTIQSADSLDGGIVSKGVNFFQNQRDGADVIAGSLDRQPSHLNDRSASIYQLPHFPHPAGNDIIDGNLHRIGSKHVNVEGGWFDAGDYLKFTHTAAYADVVLEASQRALGSAAPSSLAAEATYGEHWLSKMWDAKSKTLYLQVGIGSGDRSGSYYGDHDLWRLPQADDHDSKPKDRLAAAHRPVFRAAAPGHPISPNLAGRVAASFAMAAQLDASDHAGRARHELATATAIYRLADTKSPPHPLVTAEPYGYYPEDSWHDDMTLGGAEIALARLDLHESATSYLKQAAHWAVEYHQHDANSETFNLYDTSALGDSDLAQAIERSGTHARLAVSRSALLGELRRQIKGGIRRAGRDPFGNGGFIDEFDIDSHTFGMIATVAMYDAATRSDAYQSFATEQRDWLFGANPWSASFMVGEGQNFPECMQHQVANLSGSLNGTGPIDTGAVVNGPNGKGLFRGGLSSFQEHVRHCPANKVDRFAPFTGHGSRYIDDERSWQTNEPGIDMSGTAVLAGALTQSRAH